MSDLKKQLEKAFYPYVLKATRYLGNEYNVVIKNPQDVELRVALCFPELYELGMSHVGFEILYHILNREPNIWAERVYAPWVDAEAILREKQIPLFSLESKTPLSEFHVLGFTLQYELTFTNILNMLDLAGIPVRSRDRSFIWPLVIAGGPLSGNPEPVAEFFDAVLVGDGEEAVLEMSRLFIQARKEGWDKQTILKRLAGIQGMYVPAFYQPIYNAFGEYQGIKKVEPEAPDRIVKRVLPELKSENYPVKPLVPITEITHDRISVEIMRGCTEGCRFCSAGMIYRPVRQRPVSDIVEQTRRALESSGYDEVGLLSLNTSDYDQLHWLMAKEKALVANQNVRFSFPSLRLDAVTVDMVDFAAMVKKSGFTFAPEAGSQRLRNVISKNIREEDIFRTLNMVLENGWQLVKFYFMIGLPTETIEDVNAIADLMNRILQFARGYGKVKFHVGVSPFSPKPHTPFQWEKQEHPQVLEKKLQLLRDQLTSDRIRLTWRDPLVVSLETALARGDRRLADVIETAWRAGARFDGWKEQFRWELWEEAFQQHGIDWQKRLDPISVTVPLPWDHIDIGVLKSYLKKERLRAYAGEASPDCKDHICLGCGLQRKVFEKYVSCYKQQVQGRPQQASVSLSAAASSVDAVAEEAPIRYGRRSRKRTVPQPLVKKKIRVRYSKTGPARYISHLDIVRIFDRATRRANIPMVYTQGFNPHPKLSFGPPLATGIASVAEYLDMEVMIGREADIQYKLNLFLPEGMKILQFKAIYTKVPALAAIINRSTYEVFLEGVTIPQDWIDDWLAQPEVVVQRQVKEEIRSVDIRPFVTRMELSGDTLQLSIDVKDGRTAKVTEVLESLLAPHGMDYRQFVIQRTGQYIVDGETLLTPFDVI
ncbi:MAG: TIGR03960 family B12-binding radical SAM protein [Calditrichaeota bacterium]|nr:TIGR03960 family B12-binding radical SAM protein [Calditrichota bacterium]